MNKVVRHILFWVVIYFVWNYMKSYGDITARFWITGLINVASYAAIYYCLVNWQIPRYFEKGKWITFGVSLIISTIIIMLLWYGGTLFLSQFISLSNEALPRTISPYFLETIQMFVPGTILLAWESYTEKQEEEERLHLLEKEHLSNELKYLKAQVNPNFLFNTLKSLQTYVKEESPKAPDIILRLSAMLDYLLYRSQQPKVNLKEEIKAIEDFVALEKLRYGDNLEVQLAVDTQEVSTISPLILLSIIQEFLKEQFLINKQFLSVEAKISGMENKILFQIQSTDSPGITDQQVETIKRQLDLSYPQSYQLDMKSSSHLSLTLNNGDE